MSKYSLTSKIPINVFPTPTPPAPFLAALLVSGVSRRLQGARGGKGGEGGGMEGAPCPGQQAPTFS